MSEHCRRSAGSDPHGRARARRPRRPAHRPARGELSAGLRPRLCYVVANFQNPSGATLSLDRRRHLADLADRYGFVVVEDDPYGVLRFRGSPLPASAHLHGAGRHARHGVQALAPGLRVGWLAAPPWLHGPLVRLKQAADLHTSTLCQRMAVDVLSDDEFMAGHLARLGPFYGERCDALSSALELSLGARVAFDRPDGGMFLWVRLRRLTRVGPGAPAASRRGRRGVRAWRGLLRRRYWR